MGGLSYGGSFLWYFVEFFFKKLRPVANHGPRRVRVHIAHARYFQHCLATGRLHVKCFNEHPAEHFEFVFEYMLVSDTLARENGKVAERKLERSF